MIIKHKDLKIDPDKPFAECKLNREKYATVLTELIKNLTDGGVIAIDNEWGTGKTTFVKMWKGHLCNNEFKTLYFNAWENDFQNDAFIALISELKEFVDEIKKSLFDHVISKAVPLFQNLITGIAKTQIEKVAGKDFADNPLSPTAQSFIRPLDKEVEAYINRKKSITEFQNSLAELVHSVSNSKPLIFFIDEIDRCRPSYAIEVLEQIKHLFSVKGIIFVLSIDKDQLGKSIKNVYGSINTDEYLRRFIDIEYSIPTPSTELFCNYLYTYFDFDNFFQQDDVTEYRESRRDKKSFLSFVSVLFKKTNLPLRVQEKIYAHTRLALKAYKLHQYLFPSLFIFLIYLKIKKPLLYIKIHDLTYSLQELVNDIESHIHDIILDEKDISMFLFTEALLIRAYRKKLIIKSPRSENSTEIAFKSTINDIDKYEERLSIMMDDTSKYYEIDLSTFFYMIDLTKPFI